MPVDPLYEVSHIIRPLGFFGFFAVAGLAFIFSDHSFTREAFIAILISGLLLASLTGAWSLPFVQYHKYTSAQDDDYTYYAIYIEDASGNEIRDDSRAISPGGSHTTISQIEDDEFDETAAFMLTQARDHREEVERGAYSGVENLRFPPPSLSNTWTAEELAAYDEFVAINIYRVHIVYEEDGHEVVEMDRERIHRVTIDDIEDNT